jgi:hypothetical protein
MSRLLTRNLGSSLLFDGWRRDGSVRREPMRTLVGDASVIV